MKDTWTFKSNHFGGVCKIKDVYWIECRVCSKQYTDGTKTRFLSRRNNYKSTRRKFMSKKKPTATTTKQSLTQKRSTFLFLSLPNST